MSLLSGLYGRVATLRRTWYATRPDARHRLARPVISVGNLAVGGSGKTPLVAALARLLQQQGERPAILTRGYARREQADGVVIASDGASAREPVARTGDEAQMLARALDGVPVLVSPDRYLAGRLAEERFGCTVHLLDDGFQHLQLARSVDLLLLSGSDLDDQVLPSGRLREPLDAARAADALIVSGSEEDLARVTQRFAGTPVFRAVPRSGALIMLDGTAITGSRGRVHAVAGIARPERVAAALRAQGFEVAGETTFRDHHWFTADDIARIEQSAGSDLIVTTAKDAVRLAGLTPAKRWAVLPLELAVEPPDSFSHWLTDRLRTARAA